MWRMTWQAVCTRHNRASEQITLTKSSDAVKLKKRGSTLWSVTWLAVWR